MRNLDSMGLTERLLQYRRPFSYSNSITLDEREVRSESSSENSLLESYPIEVISPVPVPDAIIG